MGEKSIDFLGQLMTCNTTLSKIDLTYNIVRPSLVEEIQQNCNRNKSLSQTNQVPDYQKELTNLLLITNNGDACSL